jgi:hypothetical protein
MKKNRAYHDPMHERNAAKRRVDLDWKVRVGVLDRILSRNGVSIRAHADAVRAAAAVTPRRTGEPWMNIGVEASNHKLRHRKPGTIG